MKRLSKPALPTKAEWAESGFEVPASLCSTPSPTNPTPKPVMGQLRVDGGCIIETMEGRAVGASSEQYAAELCRRWNVHLELVAGLTDLFALLDEGLLVRDITADALPDYAVRQLKLVSRLATAHQALKHATEPKPINQER